MLDSTPPKPLEAPWITASADDTAILEEIYRQTDRGAALIASAYLEDRLLDAIKSRINRDDKIENNLFRGSGALAAFSTKIDLGFLLGIYNSQLHYFLHTIRNIRNEFAHVPQPRDFNSQRMAALSNNLGFSAEFHMRNKTIGQQEHIIFKMAETPRELFMNAVRLILLFLDMEIKQLPLRKPAPPVIQLAPGKPAEP